MKNVDVVAAIITENGKVYATQRGYGDFKDGWEFPGGKVEPGETKEAALKREIEEELNTEINVDSFLCTVEQDYPKFHIKMDCFMCSIVSGNLELKEHENAVWLTKNNIDNLAWLPADIKILDYIKDRMQWK